MGSRRSPHVARWLRLAAVSIAAVPALLACSVLRERAVPAPLPVAPVAEADGQPVGSDYILGPEDVLLISVWREEALTKSVTVRPDGKISFPLIPDLQAGGLTALELRDRITEILGRYVEDPSVSVVVLEPNSFKIFLLGEIAKPGMYRLRSRTTLLQAISLAGGFRDFASPNGTKVIRQGSDGSTVIRVKVNDIIKRAAVEQDLPLQPGDIIVVP